MNTRLAEFSPSFGLWPFAGDILLDEIFQIKTNCSEFGRGLPSWLWARGTSPVRRGWGTALFSPQKVTASEGQTAARCKRRQRQSQGRGKATTLFRVAQTR